MTAELPTAAAAPRVLGVPVHPVTSEQALAKVRDHLARRAPLVVVTLNAEMAMLAGRDAEFRTIVEGSDLVLPDGSGVVWALRRQGVPARKLAGVDFVRDLARLCAADGRRLYLLGAAPGVAEEAGARLQAEFPGLPLAGFHDGFFTQDQEPALLASIREARADVVLAALGVPRQEKWLAAHLADLGATVGMGVGGSLDVIAGRVQRAPGAFRALHLEWLYRLLREPWRWRRMADALPAFVAAVLSARGASREAG